MAEPITGCLANKVLAGSHQPCVGPCLAVLQHMLSSADRLARDERTMPSRCRHAAALECGSCISCNLQACLDMLPSTVEFAVVAFACSSLSGVKLPVHLCTINIFKAFMLTSVAQLRLTGVNESACQGTC